MLGLFVRHSGSPFYAHLAEAFERQAAVRGYEVLTVASGDKPDESNYRSLMVLAGLRTAGIVVAVPTVDPQTIRQVAARVPLALVGQMGQPLNPEVPYVAPDPTQGEVIIDHVAALGHQSIALLAPSPLRAPTQWARIELMQQQLEEKRLSNRTVVIQDDTDVTEVVAELHRAGVTAILCNTDATALDVLAAAARLGLSVPEDLSVTGYDGVPPYDHKAIGLTTYRIPVVGMATAAIDLVDKLVQGEELEKNSDLLVGELVVGRTTGPTARNRQ